jgi:uncharacterized protein (TIGR00106 family)
MGGWKMVKLLIAELSVVPIGTSSTGLSDYISRAVQAVKDAGVKYQLHSMGTIFEVSDIEKALKIAKAAHEAVIKTGARRVLTTLRIDERLDQPRSMEERVRRVASKVK